MAGGCGLLAGGGIAGVAYGSCVSEAVNRGKQLTINNLTKMGNDGVRAVLDSVWRHFLAATTLVICEKYRSHPVKFVGTGWRLKHPCELAS